MTVQGRSGPKSISVFYAHFIAKGHGLTFTVTFEELYLLYENILF